MPRWVWSEGYHKGIVKLTIGQNGDLIYNEPVHELNTPITDLQWSQDRTYFITACKDKTSKVHPTCLAIRKTKC